MPRRPVTNYHSDSPIEIIIGTLFLYKLLGVSCFFGLAVTCLFLPMNHFAGKVVVGKGIVKLFLL